MLWSPPTDNVSCNEPPTRYYDLAVHGARQQWQRIRWALFVFPDITDVVPTDDPDVVRVFYEGTRPYPGVWAIELLQRGFDVPPVGQHGGPQSPVRPGRTAGESRSGKLLRRRQGRRGLEAH